MKLKWRKVEWLNKKGYVADLFSDKPKAKIQILVYRNIANEYWVNFSSISDIILHQRLKKAENFKDAANIAEKRLVRILNNWVDLLT